MDHRHPPPPHNDFFFQDGPYHGHDEWWHGPLHALFLLLFVALLVLAAIWLVRHLSPAAAQAAAPAVVPAGAVAGTAAADDPAVATLRMRYAKGEVSREDYRNAIEDLTGEAPAASWPGEPPPEETST